MSQSITTYLQDHLAGAKFAISLLEDLAQQRTNLAAADVASRLLLEVQSDREVLEQIIKQIGGDSSLVKEATAWLTQKASRATISMGDAFGVFEAIELLSLGVLGKLALWAALELFSGMPPGIGLKTLQVRAKAQHSVLEQLRFKLAAITLNS